MIYPKFIPNWRNFTPRFSHICACFTFILLWEFFLRSNFIALVAKVNFGSDVYGKFDTPSHGIEEFRKLDINQNKQLSLNEWLPYYYQCHKNIGARYNLPNLNENVVSKSNSQKGINGFQDKETISLHCYFSPLRLESSLKDFLDGQKKNPNLFQGLLNWTEPFRKAHKFFIEDFKEFLPHKQVSCGDTWWVLPPVMDETIEQASSFVYTAQNPSLFLEKLFQMFHPRPFLLTRFKPQGILAGLIAENDDMLHIIFRAHVEFQLEEPPNFPFWFTPSQFKGSLMIDKKLSKIYSFEMEVPSERNLNIDMEWLYGPNEKEDTEVDLGFSPLMKITSYEIDGVHKPKFKSQNTLANKNIFWSCFENATWNNIEETMYPFKKVCVIADTLTPDIIK